MAPKADTSERSCVVTRAAQPAEALIRFVRAPDGAVVPDLRGKLPGRGVWVTGRRDMVAEAVRRKLFARGFKAEAVADADLAERVDALLMSSALQSLSIARKAGLVLTGFGKVSAALGRGRVAAVIHAAEAAEDGRRKVTQALRRRVRIESGAADVDDADGPDDEDWDDDDLDDDIDAEAMDAPTPAPEPGPPDANRAVRLAIAKGNAPKVIAGLFAGAELDLALGGANVIHAALLAGGASTSFLKNAAALARYRGGVPETDWTADLGDETATR